LIGKVEYAAVAEIVLLLLIDLGLVIYGQDRHFDDWPVWFRVVAVAALILPIVIMFYGSYRWGLEPLRRLTTTSHSAKASGT
jgi:hypothetical protein